MANHIKKLEVRIVIALILGLLLASRTTIQAPCTTVPPGEDVDKCISFPDALTQPSKLISNEQNSLVRFSTTFAATSLTVFGALSAYSFYINREPNLQRSKRSP